MDSLSRREKRFVGFGLGTYSKKVASVEKSYNHNTKNFFKFSLLWEQYSAVIRITRKVRDNCESSRLFLFIKFFCFCHDPNKVLRPAAVACCLRQTLTTCLLRLSCRLRVVCFLGAKIIPHRSTKAAKQQG